MIAHMPMPQRHPMLLPAPAPVGSFNGSTILAAMFPDIHELICPSISILHWCHSPNLNAAVSYQIRHVWNERKEQSRAQRRGISDDNLDEQRHQRPSNLKQDGTSGELPDIVGECFEDSAYGTRLSARWNLSKIGSIKSYRRCKRRPIGSAAPHDRKHQRFWQR